MSSLLSFTFMVKGIYVLVISINKDIEVKVGALGSKIFDRGLYVYVGSAQSSLETRVKRHFRKVKKKFWHIDYLLSDSAVSIVEVFYKMAGKEEECLIAKDFCEKAIPIRGFGSSDCKCTTHLFKLNNLGFLKNLNKNLKSYVL